MVRVIILPGNNDEVLAPLNFSWHYLRTKPKMVMLKGKFIMRMPDIAFDFDKDPHKVIVRAIFDHHSLRSLIDPGCVAVYFGGLVDAFEITGNTEITNTLKKVGVNKLSLIVLETNNYKTL